MLQFGLYGELCSQSPGLVLAVVAACVLAFVACSSLWKEKRRNQDCQDKVRSCKGLNVSRRSKVKAVLLWAVLAPIGTSGVYGGVLIAQFALNDSEVPGGEEVALIGDQAASNFESIVEYYPTSSFKSLRKATAYSKEAPLLTSNSIDEQRVPQTLPMREPDDLQGLEETRRFIEAEPKESSTIERENNEQGTFFPIGSVSYGVFAIDRAAFSLKAIMKKPNVVSANLGAKAAVPKIVQTSTEEPKDSFFEGWNSSEADGNGALGSEKANASDCDISAKYREAYYKALRSFVTIYGLTEESPYSYEEVEVAGCGFLVEYDRKHYVITNRHVFEEIKKFPFKEIVLPDSAIVRPVAIFVCEKYDVAVLVLNENENLEQHSAFPCEIGDCYRLQLFETVLTIGAPANMAYTPALGKVSYPCRERMALDSKKNGYDGYIQIDVTVQNGNSGGPVVNSDGEVVAMTTALATQNSMEYGLAIPINDVIRVARVLIEKKGRWDPTRIVGFSDTDFEAVSREGYHSDYVKVCGASNSSATVEGNTLKVGDVILKYNGFEVQNRWNLFRMIALSDPSQKAKLEIIRDSQPMEVEVELTVE